MAETLFGTDLTAKLILLTAEADEKAFDILDSKAGLILGFALVTLGELLGFLLLASGEGHPLKIVYPRIVEAFFYAGMSLLMAGSIFATSALYPRPFARAPVMITPHSSLVPDSPLVSLNVEGLIKVIAKAKERNTAKLKKKAMLTQVAAILVPAGLVCFAFVVMVLFRSLVQ